MINSINNIIQNRSLKYIKDFMINCSIEEKIDTHYITVDIINRHEIKIKKANGNEIDRIDLILNSMWNKLFLDWNYLKVSNPEWFRDHAGYSITMFYFPCDTPLLTKYNSEIRYVFDKVYFNDQQLNAKYTLEDLKFPDAYKISYKHLLKKIDNPEEHFEQYKEKLLSKEISASEVFKMLVDKDNEIFATESPEGFIFKYNSKLYQTDDPAERKIVREKSSYEFLLGDFIKYCKVSNYTEKINLQSYVKTICNLFNDYIINWERKNHTIENNIEIESLENPNLGEKFDIGYEYIPDQVTKSLCQENLLYKNIFKVLLANLRKGKDITHCILLGKKQVEEWNTITKNIKIHLTGYTY